MPFYYSIKNMARATRKRTLKSMSRLRAQLDAEMPSKTRARSLILGTWNIRNFDDNRFVNGRRTPEDLLYIAEIISRFDILAVQEICEELGPLDDLMALLGPDYSYIVTDKTEGRSGNDERLGFIYDRAKVRFTGVAGELVLPDSMQVIHDGKKRQFSRTPFMCGFQAGWFKFNFSTVHIYFGSDSGEKYRRRVQEIDKVAKFLAKRAKERDDTHILVGDFNIKRSGSEGFNALESAGFTIYENREGSNKDQTKFYDQISFVSRRNRVQLGDSTNSKGVLQFFDSIFTEDDFSSYKASLVKALDEKIINLNEKISELTAKIGRATSQTSINKHRKKIEGHETSIAEFESWKTDPDALKSYYLREWRTFHASDHLPLWVELKIDFSEEYLAYLHTL